MSYTHRHSWKPHCLFLPTLVAKKDHDYQDPYDYEEDYGNDESGDSGNKCPIIDLPPGLGGRCDVSDLCSKITCDVKVQGRHATIVFKVNRCKDPLTATVTFKSPGFVVDWSHTFKDGEVIKLPEDHTITEGLNSLAKVSVSLKVGLKRNGEKLHFKVFFLVLLAHLRSYTTRTRASAFFNDAPICCASLKRYNDIMNQQNNNWIKIMGINRFSIFLALHEVKQTWRRWEYPISKAWSN